MNTFPPSETGKNRAVTARLRVARLLGSARGSALVISLVFIILITIAIVGFVTTATLERKTVQSHYGRVQAGLYSTMAVDVVASRISQATTGTSTWWVSQPGRIAMTSFTSSSTTTFISLYSGSAGTVERDISINLNPASFTQGTGLLDGDSSKSLPVNWIYVRKDGSQEVSGTTAPQYDKANPVEGRYAYWTDDESCRINVNTAASYVTPQDAGISHPSNFDLTELTPLSDSDVINLRSARQSRIFNSVEEVKSVQDNPPPQPGVASRISTAVAANKVALTHYNHTPELNRFGEPRIVLTTQKNRLTPSQLERSNAGQLIFFDILAADNTDPGVDGNLSKTKIEALFAKLYPYFNKSAAAWGLPGPVTFNKTLFSKYAGFGAAQIIINLIDYVRSMESQEVLVLPLRGAFQAPNFIWGVGGYGATGNYGLNSMRGNSRRLHIVEMGIVVPGAPVTTVKLKVKLYRDQGSGPRISLVGLPFQYTVVSSSMSFANTTRLITAGEVSGSDPTIGPGGYRTITLNVPVTVMTRPAIVAMRLAIKNSSNISYDITPIADYPGRTDLYVQYQVDPLRGDGTAVPEADISSSSTGDPVVNQCGFDWKMSVGANSFGSQDPPPNSQLGKPAAISSIQPDSDENGNITGVGIIIPSPKLTADNPVGIVSSVGEIGRVHSGGLGTTAQGTPWRSIRLQPRQGSANAVVPDWLLLDLFTVPLPGSAADQAMFRPFAEAAGGRVNINGRSGLYPFSSGQIAREEPLRAVLQKANPADADTLFQNIVAKTLASGTTGTGIAFGNSDLISDKLYLMPGELCEIKGISDKGEASELTMQKLAGLLTTNSNVFSVYSVGQKIQQLPNGTIKILGESRNRSLLERYQDGIDWKVRVVSTTELGI